MSETSRSAWLFKRPDCYSRQAWGCCSAWALRCAHGPWVCFTERTGIGWYSPPRPQSWRSYCSARPKCTPKLRTGFFHLTVKFGGIAALVLAGRVSPALVLLLFALGPLSGFVLWRATAGREFTKALNGQHLQLTARLWHYGRWFLITFGLAALVSRLDIFLLSKWSTLSEVGIFSAGQVIAWVPVLIGTYLAVVLTPRIMPLAREGRFNAFYRKFQPPLLGACVLGYLLSLAAIPLIGPRLLPRSFMRSMPVISVLLPGALAGLATFPLTLSFVMFVRPKFLFFMDCISLPILMLLFFCVIPRYGAVGAAWVTSAANMIRAMVAQWMAWQWAQEIDITSSKRLPLEVMD